MNLTLEKGMNTGWKLKTTCSETLPSNMTLISMKIHVKPKCNNDKCR